jgi:radical SAM superfamily enzyme YgiQ (UPF0313 family)
LKAAGFDVHFIDTVTEDFENRWYLSEHLLAFGLSNADTVDRLADLKPDFILITSTFTFEQVAVDPLVREIKRRLPGIPVIIGGTHASFKPEWLFEECSPDFIVIGEGEQTIVELLMELSCKDPDPSKVAGIAFQNNGLEVTKTRQRKLLTDLDRPWAYEDVLLNPDGSLRYLEMQTRRHPYYGSKIANTQTGSFDFYGSRGCPNACKYCTATRRAGAKIRHMGARRIFNQFLHLRRNYGVSAFYNFADAFCGHREDIRFLKMLRDYRDSSNDTDFVLHNPNAFSLHTFLRPEDDYKINYNLLDLLYDAGVVTIAIAIETLSTRFNSKIEWGRIRPEQVIDLLQAISSRGFNSDIYMMYGFPGQTWGQFQKDLKFAEQAFEVVDLLMWNFFSVFPGSRYYEELVRIPGREREYRRMIKDRCGIWIPTEEGNWSEVAVSRFRQCLLPFGKIYEQDSEPFKPASPTPILQRSIGQAVVRL